MRGRTKLRDSRGVSIMKKKARAHLPPKTCAWLDPGRSEPEFSQGR